MKLSKKFAFFVTIGTASAITEIIFFNILFLILNFPISRALAIAISLSVNFILNRNITFQAKSKNKTTQFPKHITVHATAITFNYLVSLLAVSLLGPGTLNANIATITGIVSAIPITFFGSLYWTFKK